jgi:Cytochrome c oxidase subunit VIa
MRKDTTSTYAAIACMIKRPHRCTACCVSCVGWESTEHAILPITQEKITYPYMHVRSKTFPWGDCGLFEHCEEEGEGEE